MTDKKKFNVAKVVDALPATLSPNTVYFVKTSSGVKMFVTSNDTPVIAHQVIV